ncbi:MAG: hypothetical protein M3R25_01615 [Bacteroidota bacterium]|nr:hypothetical protein [Bacteroidota bacterium]
MESQYTPEKSPVVTERKISRKTYWLVFFVSLIACVTLVVVSPEWFWLTLPFLLTSFVGAIDMM